MLEQELENLYLKFRLRHYQLLFDKLKEHEGSLNATEAFSAEVIHLLNRPTVKEFADFLNISQPNASYKINNLMQKGYLKKRPSEQDKREHRLEVTERFLSYYGNKAPFIAQMLEGLRAESSEEDLELVLQALRRVSAHLD